MKPEIKWGVLLVLISTIELLLGHFWPELFFSIYEILGFASPIILPAIFPLLVCLAALYTLKKKKGSSFTIKEGVKEGLLIAITFSALFAIVNLLYYYLTFLLTPHYPGAVSYCYYGIIPLFPQCFSGNIPAGLAFVLIPALEKTLLIFVFSIIISTFLRRIK